MRIGDWIDNYKGHSWVIQGVGDLSHVCPDFRSGRYVFMTAGRFYPTALPDKEWELLARLEHEDDVRAHWTRGTTFAVGQTIRSYRRLHDDVRIHAINGSLVTLIDKGGRMFADWLWHLSMREGFGTSIDFEAAAVNLKQLRADHLGEVDA